MADSDFATTILTSKEPEEVANFVPHSLHLSSALIEKNLVPWFSNYSNMLMRYNQDLNMLVSKGRDFFADTDGEFGSVDKIWNCVASNVMSQIAVNDLLIRAIRNDILTPFSATFKTDFKYPELIVNSNELLEMLKHLSDPNGAYNWNVKAPAILSNLENFKQYEKSMMFDGFLSYLNAYNSKTASALSKNENAVNYILKEFSVDSEMAMYTEHVILAKPPAASLPPPPPPSSSKHGNHSSLRASIASTPSTLSTEKRKSKLRSKMGSILGRKKKNSPLKQSDTIPEELSMGSVSSRQATSSSIAEPSHGTPLSNNGYDQLRGLGVSTGAGVAAGVGAVGATLGAAVAATQVMPSSDKRFSGIQGLDTKPLQPSQPSQSLPPLQPSHILQTSPPPSAGILPTEKELPNPLASQSESEDANQNAKSSPKIPEDDANLVKYSSSEDDSDVPTDRDGNRISMLQAHDLDHPPKLDKLDTDSDFRSRYTSSGKYSFEYGDEEKSMSAMQTPKSTATPQLPLVQSGVQPEISLPLSSEAVKPQPAFDQFSVSASSASRPLPPPPPPSRKVYHPVNESPVVNNQRDVSSFSQASNVRELYVQPHQTGGRASLISQTTGNSLFKLNDYFKHFESNGANIKEGLNTSVAEIINVNFQSGKPQKAVVLGEIAFNYNSSEPLASYDVEIPTKFTKFLLNDKILQKTGESMYKLDITQIQSRTLGGVKYMMDLSQPEIPLIVKQIWKFEPHQASLIIRLSLNPSYTESVQFENLTISATLDSSVTSTSASSKPEGSFNKDANRITWRYTKPLVLSPDNPEEKLIARIMSNGEAKEAASGVQVKFSINNPPVPFAEILDSLSAPVPSVRTLSTGNYSSHM